MSAEHSAEYERRAVERITSTQARCGTKLMQVPADFVWPGSKFEAGDVDVEFLVQDILDAAQVGRLVRALNDLAEAAEVAAQGGIHGAHSDGEVRADG